MSAPMGKAVSQHGTPVTVFVEGHVGLAFARPGRDFICTQDSPNHQGAHSACDGQGHILAKWPRRDPEQFWTGCDDHHHHGVWS